MHNTCSYLASFGINPFEKILTQIYLARLQADSLLLKNLQEGRKKTEQAWNSMRESRTQVARAPEGEWKLLRSFCSPSGIWTLTALPLVYTTRLSNIMLTQFVRSSLWIFKQKKDCLQSTFCLIFKHVAGNHSWMPNFKFCLKAWCHHITVLLQRK